MSLGKRFSSIALPQIPPPSADEQLLHNKFERLLFNSPDITAEASGESFLLIGPPHPQNAVHK